MQEAKPRHAKESAIPANEDKRNIIQLLGPGFITGAADDDPSGIGTYSQVGAQFGFGMLWTMLYTYPLMCSIQEIAARIGRTTGGGIAFNLRKHYPKWFGVPTVFLLSAANILNIGADIGAMSASLKLLVGGWVLLYDVLIAAVCFFLPAMLSYKRYAAILKWGGLVLLAYVVVVFLPSVHVHWSESLQHTVIPNLAFNKDYLAAFVAVLGTTISPYLFFWQASEEAEEVRLVKKDKPLITAPEQAPKHLQRIRVDTYIGMLFSNAVAWFIILAAATTLNAHGHKDIASAQQAAEALQPLGGNAAFILFAAGIFATGLHAVPILAGSTAYAIGEEYKRRVGIDFSPPRAPFFYFVFALTTAIGLAINFTAINPIKALIWSALINGIVSVPVMIAMMLMIRNKQVMGPLVGRGRVLIILGWISTIVMAAAVVGMFLTL